MSWWKGYKWQRHKTSAHNDDYFKNKYSKKKSDGKEKKKDKKSSKPPGLTIDKAALTAAKNGDIAGFLVNLPGISEDKVKD